MPMNSVTFCISNLADDRKRAVLERPDILGLCRNHFHSIRVLCEPLPDLRNSEYAGFDKHTFHDQYEIYTPPYLLPDDSLNSAAILRFSDFSNEVFIMVLEEKNEILTDGEFIRSWQNISCISSRI